MYAIKQALMVPLTDFYRFTSIHFFHCTVYVPVCLVLHCVMVMTTCVCYELVPLKQQTFSNGASVICWTPNPNAPNAQKGIIAACTFTQRGVI